MAAEINPNTLLALTSALGSVLELSGASRVIDACNRLSQALESLQTPKPSEIPEGVRSEIHGLVALLAFPDWEAVARWAAMLPIDLRDLNEAEVAYIERVTPKAVREWRTQGTGPAYRNEAGIRYPVRELWIWRQKGRQTITAQRVRRGRRR